MSSSDVAGLSFSAEAASGSRTSCVWGTLRLVPVLRDEVRETCASPSARTSSSSRNLDRAAFGYLLEDSVK